METSLSITRKALVRNSQWKLPFQCESYTRKALVRNSQWKLTFQCWSYTRKYLGITNGKLPFNGSLAQEKL